MSVHSAVIDLITTIKSTVTKSQDPKMIISAVTPVATKLAKDQSWLKPEYYECDQKQGMGITVLNEEPDHSIFIETVAWLPGRAVAPHDHQTWGIVVGIDGTEVNVHWQRLDDGTKEDFAELRVLKEREISAGDVVHLLPDDIHSVRNEGNTTSLSLHIYGQALSSLKRYEFDPINKIRRICPQRVRRK